MTTAWKAFADLTPYEVYGILRLRIAVFAVEQHCVYQDIDGRDTEPATRHGWVEEDGEIVSYLRILNGPCDEVIGRVVTAPHARGRGLGARLMREALDRTSRPVRLEAQSYLLDWYGSFGFVPRGREYLEDGIPHTSMVLAG